MNNENALSSNFILNIARKSRENGNLLKNFVDSTGQTARMTTYMKDVKTDRMEAIESGLLGEIAKVFPPERYSVFLTGKALLFLKGTKYLVRNLLLSLGLAILLIALFIAYLFRSFRMIIISLIPNLLPLIITAGVMGFQYCLWDFCGRHHPLPGQIPAGTGDPPLADT